MADQVFPKGGVNLLFGKMFAEIYMKFKQIGPKRGVDHLDPWMLENATKYHNKKDLRIQDPPT